MVLGDNGYALLDVNEVLIEISSTDPSIGGDDDIVVGDGDDIVVAGVGRWIMSTLDRLSGADRSVWIAART